ncbi:MAG: ComF family protein [Bacteroidetes bacterium]|nr:ComF family protein [Bacteroidota bacterium]
MNWSYLEDFARLFFPHFCYGCGGSMVSGEKLLCTSCIMQLPYLSYGQNENNPLTRRLVSKTRFEYGFALLRFKQSGLAQNLLHALKYQAQPEIGFRLGQILGLRMSRQGFSENFDLVLPVPIHVSRERVRGYNQSEAFANGVAAGIGKEAIIKSAVRLRKTETQTRKDKMSRWRNVEGSFKVLDPEVIRGKRILIVDDVITTGATVEACAAEIMKYDPISLGAACIADVV